MGMRLWFGLPPRKEPAVGLRIGVHMGIVREVSHSETEPPSVETASYFNALGGALLRGGSPNS